MKLTTSVRSLVLLSATGLVAGCGDFDINKVDPGGGASSKSVVTVRASAGTKAEASAGENNATATAASSEPGVLKGSVSLDGPAPKISPLVAAGQAKADPSVCAKSEDIPDESFVVGASGGIANVFIYLDKAPAGYVADVAAKPALDQKLCIFRPHALLVPVGAEFALKNSDTVPHNVGTNPQKNAPENNNMTPGSSMNLKFKRAEKEPFDSRCAIHPWMKFYTLVLDHPLAAVTDAEGKFEIANVPAGKHKFRVWHETKKQLETVTVDIKGGQTTELPLKYNAAKFGL